MWYALVGIGLFAALLFTVAVVLVLVLLLVTATGTAIGRLTTRTRLSRRSDR